jgi:hypothetical protein
MHDARNDCDHAMHGMMVLRSIACREARQNSNTGAADDAHREVFVMSARPTAAKIF